MEYVKRNSRGRAGRIESGLKHSPHATSALGQIAAPAKDGSFFQRSNE